jgi:hypothetical protein
LALEAIQMTPPNKEEKTDCVAATPARRVDQYDQEFLEADLLDLLVQ